MAKNAFFRAAGVREEMSATEDKEEQEHWHDVLRTFLLYEDFVSLDVERR